MSNAKTDLPPTTALALAIAEGHHQWLLGDETDKALGMAKMWDAHERHTAIVEHAEEYDRIRGRLGLTDPNAVGRAIDASQARGFTGKPGKATRIGDDAHALWLVECSFPDGSTSPYVVAADEHNNAGPPVLLPLSAAVHLLQNTTPTERWAIEARPA